MEKIERFLDEAGRLKIWPAKQANKQLALEYLAGKFEVGREYSEHEVNAILGSWHAFSDPFILRRGLVDSGLLQRKRDGSIYWKTAAAPADA